MNTIQTTCKTGRRSNRHNGLQSAVADYNLTYEEVKIVDPEIEKITSEADYNKFQM
ncbi:MAG: hypothetical protein WC879_18845 [Melioribacteraceae bacterium]